MEVACEHKLLIARSQELLLEENSVHLIVTSPPYPMIEMWDEIMAAQNGEIRQSLDAGNGALAFELMHKELDKVWKNVDRALVAGGIACINIGDATRTINENFALYSNHSRIISAFLQMGFSNLPNIIWRKPTNAPNKFMGSGMLPPGAYVTLEHEWILIFRKGNKRNFKTDAEKLLRKESAFFWEERNNWFSDLWDIRGTRQSILNANSRERSAAFPFEIAYRLINMFSIKGDTVLDPFIGTGTTTIAAIASKRNSVGVDVDKALIAVAKQRIENLPVDELNTYLNKRTKDHDNFIVEEKQKGRVFKHFSRHLKVEVMTLQETEIKTYNLSKVETVSDLVFRTNYIV